MHYARPYPAEFAWNTDDLSQLFGVVSGSAVLICPPTMRPLRGGYAVAKRSLDLLLCVIALPFVLPLLALCAALIYLESPGPIVFTQLRTGKGGKRFRMFKFRTMVPNAEELKQAYAHLNELTWPDFKITNDPRLTKVGRILRKTSLDELPQLFNVILGNMSLVGPRPTSFEASTYALPQTERLEVLPGITGLWQVSGRADVDFEQRVAMDVAYIEQRSLWLDLKILVQTVATVFSRKGAY